MTHLGLSGPRIGRERIRRKLPADHLAALQALIEVLDRPPAAVSAFFATDARWPAQLAHRLRARPHPLRKTSRRP